MPASDVCIQMLLERLAGAKHACPDGRLCHIEHLSDLVPVELLPVEHLEHDLLLEWQCTKGRQQRRAILLLREAAPSTGTERGDRDFVKVQRCLRTCPAAPVA